MRSLCINSGVHPDRSVASTTAKLYHLQINPKVMTSTLKLLNQTELSPLNQIKHIVANALRHRVSDIHLEPTAEGLKVRYRIDGILRDISTVAPEISRKVVVALKVKANMDIAESRRPQDGRIDEGAVNIPDEYIEQLEPNLENFSQLIIEILVIVGSYKFPCLSPTR
jgi:Type II/IV secretion system protein